MLLKSSYKPAWNSASTITLLSLHSHQYKLPKWTGTRVSEHILYMKHFVWSTLISIHIVLFIAILEQHQPGLLFSPHARQEGAGWLEGESPHDLQLRVQHTYSAVVRIQKYCSNAMHPLGPQSQTKGWQQLSRKLSTFTICGYTCAGVLQLTKAEKVHVPTVLCPQYKRNQSAEKVLCGQHRERQLLWFDSHSHFIAPGIPPN